MVGSALLLSGYKCAKQSFYNPHMSLRHARLVDAQDLIAWAQRHESQANLPRLVRRLVLASAAGLTQAAFRAGEGVQLAGWDGVTVAGPSHGFVPDGTTGWELSTRKDVKRKADHDYANRVEHPEGLDLSQTAFIFVTLRRWVGKQKWAAKRSNEGIWRAVRAYDADDLETWLEATPAVHVWLSLQLGKSWEDALDLGTYWTDWAAVTRPALTPRFLLAGRTATVVQIHQHLRSSADTFAIKAESPDEALAVFASSIDALPEGEREAHLSRAIVAKTRAALDRLAASDVPLLLIALFQDAEGVSRAVRHGHRVVLPVAASDPDTATTVALPRLSADEAESALVESGIPTERARELAILGRRSLMALRRKLSPRPEVQQPAWASPENAPAVLPFLLAGGWHESSQADGEILGALAHTDPQRAQEAAARWSREIDPPVRHVGGVWYIASKADAWRLLAGALTRTDLERFDAAVQAVFGAPDPRFDVAQDKRWLSLERPPHSPALRQGLAETLAVMGARGATVHVGGSPADRWAAAIVRTLLERANADWRLWASLSHQLPLLAEAAPEEFLAAAEQGLTGDRPLLNLFQEQGDPLFSSSPHTGLLWALERLAWSPEHLARTALVLATLARLDPGGRLANRPAASLRDTFLLWYPQTAAAWDRQRQILRMLLEREPAAGWQLHADLLPRPLDSSTSEARPEWRDWASDEAPEVTPSEYVRRIRDVVTDMLASVGTNGRRWQSLIDALPHVPPDVHETIVQRLDAVSLYEPLPEDRVAMWGALRQIIASHRSFPNADWALPKEHVDKLDALYRRLEPDDAASRFGWLFDGCVRLPEGEHGDWQADERAIAEKRRDAVEAIHRQSGAAGVEELVDRVDDPFSLGAAFGACDLADMDEDEILSRHLAAENHNQRRFALGFATGRSSAHGQVWAEQELAIEGLSVAQRADLLTRLPGEPHTWALARSDAALDEAYWREAHPYFRGSHEDVEYAARRLMRYGRAHAAATLVAYSLKDPCPPSADLIADALEAVLRQEHVDSTSGGFSHWAGELLDALASSLGFDETRVARIEWGFAPLLRYNRPAKILHRELARSPEFFAELLGLIFRRENKEAHEASEANRNRGRHAFHVLTSWKSLPATVIHGAVDAAALDAWVDAALTITAKSGRPALGAQHVGQALSHGPHGTDGAWPHEAVRDVIERVQNRHVESGFEIGRLNARGIVSRSPTEGGHQEYTLADEYAGWAAQISDRWPRTAAVLRRIEARYRHEAQSEDAEADLRKDGLW